MVATTIFEGMYSLEKLYAQSLSFVPAGVDLGRFIADVVGVDVVGLGQHRRRPEPTSCLRPPHGCFDHQPGDSSLNPSSKQAMLLIRTEQTWPNP